MSVDSETATTEQAHANTSLAVGGSDGRWFDTLIPATSVPIAVVSLHTNRYVRANTAMAEMLGVPLRELLECDPFTLAFKVTHPDELVEEQGLFAELARGKRNSYEFVKRYCRPDGSVRWGHLTFCVVGSAADLQPAQPGAPNFEYAVLQIVDITKQIEQAEALKRMEAELRHNQKVDGLGRLAAGIAHDFNNLLTVITGHAEVIHDLVEEAGSGLRGPDVREDLRAIIDAADRGASLTAQLLAHGRREKVVPRTFVLSELVATLKRLLVRTLGSNIDVVETLTAQGAIRADQGQIGQVVMNLMLNARDAITDGGHIWLTTSDVNITEASETSLPGVGEWVALSVGDDGHGMSMEVQAHMFEPFFTTRTERPGTRGSGLGLATVRRIAEEADALIDVKSAKDSGTTVIIYFPRVEHVVGYESVPPEPAELAAGEQTVLVVEDEPAVRSLIATLLVGARYRVMVAVDGEEGMKILNSASEPIHLVITDLMMPGLGGLALARELRARDLRPRLLFISGYSTHTPSEIARYGKLLPKPFTPTQLLTTVREVLAVGTSRAR